MAQEYALSTRREIANPKLETAFTDCSQAGRHGAPLDVRVLAGCKYHVWKDVEVIETVHDNNRTSSDVSMQNGLPLVPSAAALLHLSCCLNIVAPRAMPAAQAAKEMYKVTYRVPVAKIPAIDPPFLEPVFRLVIVFLEPGLQDFVNSSGLAKLVHLSYGGVAEDSPRAWRACPGDQQREIFGRVSWAGECVIPFGGVAALQFLGRDMVEKGQLPGKRLIHEGKFQYEEKTSEKDRKRKNSNALRLSKGKDRHDAELLSRKAM
ncbi:hypothetical protein EDD85DRAFT_786130 [Armillaria nabsnona]|nr:hypothetical protein EDD85DRAFT_786130 [Armillaria nabsnona]